MAQTDPTDTATGASATGALTDDERTRDEAGSAHLDPAPEDTSEVTSDPPGRTSLVERVVTAVIVAGCAFFVFANLQPSLLVADTTAAGGDMGAHVWGPDFLRDYLLPSGQLSGWTRDWYAGFPAYHFYMVLPSLFVLAFDLLLPYNVAFKLVTVLGLVALPVSAWALGRLARLPFPGPALLAVATVPFLFNRSFSIYGGNVASTLAGEFAFSHSLAFALLFVGVVLRGLETGKHRAIAAVLLALTALCHVIPAIFAVTAGVVALLLRLDRHRLRWALSAGVVGGLLTSFWTVPFVLRRAYLNDMGWEKITLVWERLIPGWLGQMISAALGNDANSGGGDPIQGSISAAFLIAVVGAVYAVRSRHRFGIYLTVVGLVFAVGYVLAPQGRLWNARLLPFWYLCVYLLAAVVVAELLRALGRRWSEEGDAGQARRTTAVAGVAAAAVVLLAVVVPLRPWWLPFAADDETGTYRWPTARGAPQAQSFIPDWARWNYSGYERKEAYPEYDDVVDTMAEVGETRGCGRAMWEYDPSLNRFGTPMALMLLPYWTDGCIGSMEGLYFEASATTPYHFINQSELSANPSRAQRDLPYPSLDVESGVEHLRMLGVRYYLAFSEAAIAQADGVEGLEPVAGTETWAVPAGFEGGPEVTWKVYELTDVDLVEPLEAEPVVLTDVPAGGEGWLHAAVEWYVGDERDVMVAASGPRRWERTTSQGEIPRTPVGRTDVTDVEEGVDTISFSVSEPGTPVLVKTSYFPNWKADGAQGPWRVAPNLMVVVPTDEDVVLRYGSTSVEWLAWAMTLAGLVGLALLIRSGNLAFPAPATAASGDPVEGEPAEGEPAGEVPVSDGPVDEPPVGGPLDGSAPPATAPSSGPVEEPPASDEPVASSVDGGPSSTTEPPEGSSPDR